MRDAVSALDQVISSGESEVDEELVRRVLGIADNEAFFAIAGAIVARDPKATLKALHAAFEKGLDPRDLADGVSEHIRHLLVLKVDPEAEDLIPMSGEDLARLRAQAETWSEQDLLRLLRIASEVSVPMKESPQPLVHLEAAVVQMATLEPGETLAELLQRLEALEQRLSGGGEGPAGGKASAGAGGRAGGAPAPTRAVPTPAGASSRGSTTPSSPRRTDAPRAKAEIGGPPAAAPRSPSDTPSVAVGAAAPNPSESPVATLEPVADRDETTCWEAVITAVNVRKRMLGAFLQESRFLGVSERGITLGMDDLHRSVVEERENRGILIEEVARVFGRALAVHCAPLAAGAVQRPAEQDVRPLIERAVAWFEGDIIERGRGAERTDG
jgi:DNA polymerase-3 subunit gamma/tau